MADENALEILIRLGYVGADKAEEARAALAGVKNTVGDLSTSMPEGSEAWAKYKNVMKDATGEMLSHRQSAQLLHLSLREMGASMPELGMLTHLLFNPMTAGFAAAAAGMELWFKHLKTISTEFENLNGAMHKADDVIKSIINAGGSLDDKFVDAAKAMADFETSSTGAKHALEQMQFVSKMFSDAIKQSEMDAAEKTKEHNEILTARVNLLKDLGQLTDEQAALIQNQIDLENQLNELKNKKQDRTDEIQDKQSEIDQTNARLKQQPTFDAAENSKIDAQTKVAQDEAAIKKHTEDSATIDTAIATARATMKANMGNLGDPTLFAAAQQDLIGALKDKENNDKLYADAKTNLGNDEKALDLAQQQLDGIKDLKSQLEKQQQELIGLKNTDARATTREAGEAATDVQVAAMKAVGIRAKATGESEDDMLRGGAAGLATERDLIAKSGKSESQIISEGDAAGLVAPGKRTGAQNKAIDLEQHYKAAQDQVTAMKDLLTATGQSASSVTSYMTAMTKAHKDLTAFVNGEIALLTQKNAQKGGAY